MEVHTPTPLYFCLPLYFLSRTEFAVGQKLCIFFSSNVLLHTHTVHNFPALFNEPVHPKALCHEDIVGCHQQTVTVADTHTADISQCLNENTPHTQPGSNCMTKKKHKKRRGFTLDSALEHDNGLNKLLMANLFCFYGSVLFAQGSAGFMGNLQAG